MKNNYKSFIKWFIINSLIFMGIVLSIVIIIDPYYENGIYIGKFNRDKIKSSIDTARVMYNKLEKDKYSLIFGTSRNAKVNKEILGSPVLNLAQSVYGYPLEINNFLSQLTNGQIENIDKIYVLVDFHVADWEKPSNTKFNESVSLFSYMKSFNYKKAMDSYNVVKRNRDSSIDYGIDEYGSQFNRAEIIPLLTNLKNYKYEPEVSYTEKGLSYYKNINEFARKHNIKIYFYTPTMNMYYLSRVDLDKMNSFKKEVLSLIPCFYDFTYVEDVSGDIKNFTDASHMNTGNVKKIMDLLKSEPERYKATAENVENFDRQIRETLANISMDAYLKDLK